MPETTFTRNTIRRLQNMRRKRKFAQNNVGSAPGTIIKSPDAEPTVVRGWPFEGGSEDAVTITDVDSIKSLQSGKIDGGLWIDVRGLADTKFIAEIGEAFGLHPLVIEDVANIAQRPKAEVHDDDYIVIVLREPCGGPPFDSEQVAIVIGPDFVLTFQERASDIFDPVRKRLIEGSRPMRELGAPYLGYALIDSVVDSYFPILEGYGELSETLEQTVIEEPDPGRITEIHLLKRELQAMRRALWSQREAIATLQRADTKLIPDALKIYLRDCSDHSFQLLDMVEVYREISQGLVDLHLSAISNRMNEIMKVLTIISMIFLPMSFLTGLYGMNFVTTSPYNLPELKWKFGYFWALGLMLTSAGGMLYYFWRKGWIGKD
ncbi:MAG: magnesium/cobalt transporter CorA [Rhizobiaceae bacterium]|nr:magnesium/cobalt transporter CorA [Rhizobiaceae bacterium]